MHHPRNSRSWRYARIVCVLLVFIAVVVTIISSSSSTPPKKRKERLRSCAGSEVYDFKAGDANAKSPVAGSAEHKALYEQFDILRDVTIGAGNLLGKNVTSLAECLQACIDNPDCVAGHRVKTACVLKSYGMSPLGCNNHVSFQHKARSKMLNRQTPSVNRTLFAIKGSTGNLQQLSATLHTWAREVNTAVFFETSEEPTPDELLLRRRAVRLVEKFPLIRAVFQPEPSDPVMRSYKGAWKYVSILQYVFEQDLIETMDLMFVMIVDDDTFVLLPNLEVFLTWHLNDGTPLYTGGLSFTHELNVFPHGGGGVAMNRQALERLKPVVLNNRSACRQAKERWGDVRLSKCFLEVGIRPSDSPGFSYDDNHAAVALASAARRQVFPVTFHRLSRAWVFEMYNFVTDTMRRKPAGSGHVIEWTELQTRYAVLFTNVQFRSSKDQQGKEENPVFVLRQMPPELSKRRFSYEEAFPPEPRK